MSTVRENMSEIYLHDVLKNRELLRNLIYEKLEKEPMNFTVLGVLAGLDDVTIRRFMLNNTRITALTVQKLWKWLQG